MSPQIILQIEASRAQWVRDVGHFPTRVYLGAVQHKNLKEVAEKFSIVKHPVVSTQDTRLMRHRLFYDGMEAFLVDAESHLDFGSHGPPPSPAG